MDLESYLVSLLFLVILFGRSLGNAVGTLNDRCPNECDLSKCAQVAYCKGVITKDSCGCCPRCSSSTWVHPEHPYVSKGGACDQVRCPRFKVCMENMQGLPLCTCPNILICKGRKRKEVCGTDGNTYQSKCHLGVTSCSTPRLRVQHRGPCRARSTGMVATEQNMNYPESEYDIARRERRKRRREKRKQLRKNRRRMKGKRRRSRRKLSQAQRRQRRKNIQKQNQS